MADASAIEIADTNPTPIEMITMLRFLPMAGPGDEEFTPESIWNKKVGFFREIQKALYELMCFDTEAEASQNRRADFERLLSRVGNKYLEGLGSYGRGHDSLEFFKNLEDYKPFLNQTESTEEAKKNLQRLLEGFNRAYEVVNRLNEIRYTFWRRGDRKVRNKYRCSLTGCILKEPVKLLEHGAFYCSMSDLTKWRRECGSVMKDVFPEKCYASDLLHNASLDVVSGSYSCTGLRPVDARHDEEVDKYKKAYCLQKAAYEAIKNNNDIALSLLVNWTGIDRLSDVRTTWRQRSDNDYNPEHYNDQHRELFGRNGEQVSVCYDALKQELNERLERVSDVPEGNIPREEWEMGELDEVVRTGIPDVSRDLCATTIQKFMDDIKKTASNPFQGVSVIDQVSQERKNIMKVVCTRVESIRENMDDRDRESFNPSLMLMPVRDNRLVLLNNGQDSWQEGISNHSLINICLASFLEVLKTESKRLSERKERGWDSRVFYTIFGRLFGKGSLYLAKVVYEVLSEKENQIKRDDGYDEETAKYKKEFLTLLMGDQKVIRIIKDKGTNGKVLRGVLASLKWSLDLVEGAEAKFMKMTEEMAGKFFLELPGRLKTYIDNNDYSESKCMAIVKKASEQYAITSDNGRAYLGNFAQDEETIRIEAMRRQEEAEKLRRERDRRRDLEQQVAELKQQIAGRQERTQEVGTTQYEGRTNRANHFAEARPGGIEVVPGRVVEQDETELNEPGLTHFTQ